MPAINGATTVAKTTDPDDANTWRTWSNVSGKLNGTWQNAQSVYVKRNNEWEQVWIRLTDPTSLSVTSTPNSKTVNLSWNASIGAEGYNIYRGSTFIKSVTGTSTTSTVPLYYTTYTFSVKAYAGTSESGAATDTINVPIAAATTPSITSTTGTLSQTLSWSAVSGADGYTIYRRTSPTGAATNLGNFTGTSTTVTLPDFYTTYYYSIRAFNTDNGTNYSAESGQRSVSVAMSSPIVSSYNYDAVWAYTATDEWTGYLQPSNSTYYPRLFLDWGGVTGASSYVVQQLVGGTWTDVDDTTNPGSYPNATKWQVRHVSTSQTLSYRVAAVHSSGTRTVSSTYKFNNGRPQTRTNSSSTYTGWAQASWPGGTNGQFIVNFLGATFNIWVYQVKFDVSTYFSSRITLYPNRHINLIRPGVTVDLPDSEPSPSSYTYSVSGQNVSFAVDPFGTSWSSNSAGTKGTIYADCTITVYTRVINQTEVAPSLP